jgi:hypothetical protein
MNKGKNKLSWTRELEQRHYIKRRLMRVAITTRFFVLATAH